MAQRFLGKVVIVTGSSAGIGQDAATEFAKEGAFITIHGQNADRLNDTEARMVETGISKEKILKVIGSLEDPKTPAKIIEQTVQKFGKIDVLVNNAGAAGHPTIDDVDALEYLDFLYTVNFRSVVALTQLAIPYLEKTKGNVVNVSSMSSFLTQKSQSFYNSLKAALDHFTHCYADKYGPKGIRMNTINPGFIRTHIINRRNVPGAQDRFEEYAAKYTSLGRVGQVSETSSLIKFLASDEASYVTGSNYVVDGGHSLYVPEMNFG
ncbi:enoyl-(Acyl carrier protein) reductase domain-containing protein [Ditylenchus destructor]|nr:enoyl-(Acyl carrier protein) reductase domain-containing protein [Ditylenchus destructor]